MMIDKTKISGVQFMILIACFLQASGLLTSFISMVLMQDSWLSIVFGSVCIIPVILIYRSLILKFPGMNLFQIFERVFGKAIGKSISFLFVVYFVVLTVLNLTDMSDFSKLTIMNKTPSWVIIALSVMVSAYAVRHGIKVVSRYSFLFLIFSMFFLLLSIVLLFNQFEYTNFLPIFAQDPIRYVQGTHLFLAIPLGEIVIFLMFVQNVKTKKKDWGKHLFAGVFLGMTVLLLVKIRDISMLGNIYHILALPQLISLKLVNLGDALSRMEVLFAVVLILLLFFKTTLLVYVSLISICYLFEVEKYWKLIPILSLMLIVLSKIFLTFNAEEHLSLGRQTVPFIWSLFEFIIPFLTLMVGILTKKTTEKTFGKTKAYLKGNAIKNFQKIKPKTFKREVV